MNITRNVLDENSRKEFMTNLDIILKHLAIILRYTDECSDIDYFTINNIKDWNPEISITAYFKDGGVKHITSDADMFDIIQEIIDEITGPRVYDMNNKNVAKTIDDIEEKYTDQLSYKEKAALNYVIKLITDPNYLKED